MDIEKLIERLRTDSLYADKATLEIMDLCMEAADAISTLQAENEKLRNEVERQRRSADDRQHLYENAERAYINVQAELEQVKQERDAAVEYLRGKCQYCKKYLVCGIRRGPHDNCWQWRGPEED